jgi:hypothetical protein
VEGSRGRVERRRGGGMKSRGQEDVLSRVPFRELRPRVKKRAFGRTTSSVTQGERFVVRDEANFEEVDGTKEDVREEVILSLFIGRICKGGDMAMSEF